ncbi:MAG: dihydropteroate synthase [Pseudomonadota bacterium]
MTILQCGRRRLDLTRPVVMGILNVTPDSFSDGGQYFSLNAAVDHARRMHAEGALIIDVGAESTRPGAARVRVQEELDRMLPVVERLVREMEVVVSVDTSTPEVMREAAALGASFINDVRALQRPGSLQVAAAAGLPVCLMHMRGEPDTMQRDPQYADVLSEVEHFFTNRIDECLAAGMEARNIILDPGFGFGKTLEHNLDLLRGLPRLAAMGYPILAGLSRKSMLGSLVGSAPVNQRLHAGLAAASIAVLKGARIIRAHDVKATCDAVAVAAALVE